MELLRLFKSIENEAEQSVLQYDEFDLDPEISQQDENSFPDTDDLNQEPETLTMFEVNRAEKFSQRKGFFLTPALIEKFQTSS